MNNLIAFGNGDTARMNTYELYQLLKRHLPKERAEKLEHNNIVRKVKQLMKEGAIVSRQTSDQQINQGLGRKKTIKVFEFVGEEGERDMLILAAQFMPELVGIVYDRWRELRSRYQELEQKLLVLISNEALAEEAENLKAQMLDGTIDPEDAANQVAKWFRNRKGTGSKAGRALVGQKKLIKIGAAMERVAIEYVQPQLPFNV
ncbi:hypothetical protein K1U80_005120 [Escherichia coli]|nr:hypothetical protein [Escherichia coli]